MATRSTYPIITPLMLGYLVHWDNISQAVLLSSPSYSEASSLMTVITSSLFLVQDGSNPLSCRASGTRASPAAAMLKTSLSWNIMVSVKEAVNGDISFWMNLILNIFLYACLKNGRIMPWQCPSVRLSVCPSVHPSVRPSIRVFRTFFNMLSDIIFKLSIYIQ